MSGFFKNYYKNFTKMKFKIMELWASLGHHLKPVPRSNNQESCQYHPHNVEQSSSVNLDASLYFCVIK